MGKGAGELVGYRNGQDRVAEEGRAGVGIVVKAAPEKRAFFQKRLVQQGKQPRRRDAWR